MAYKRKLTDEQMAAVVKQLEDGRTAAEMAREVGVSIYTVYSWKTKYGNQPTEATWVRHLKEENNRLKKLLVDTCVDREMLKAVLIKNGLSS